MTTPSHGTARRPEQDDIRTAISLVKTSDDRSSEYLTVVLTSFFRDSVDCPEPPEPGSEETEFGWPAWAEERAGDLLTRIASVATDAWKPFVARILAERDEALRLARRDVWLPIGEADNSIAVVMHVADVVIRNSHPVWVRDADGRVYQAVWSDHRGGYWWDLEGQEQADPVEFQPHPQEIASRSGQAPDLLDRPSSSDHPVDRNATISKETAP